MQVHCRDPKTVQSWSKERCKELGVYKVEDMWWCCKCSGGSYKSSDCMWVQNFNMKRILLWDGNVYLIYTLNELYDGIVLVTLQHTNVLFCISFYMIALPSVSHQVIVRYSLDISLWKKQLRNNYSVRTEICVDSEVFMVLTSFDCVKICSSALRPPFMSSLDTVIQSS